MILFLGKTAVLDCGEGAAGLAYWQCDLGGHWLTSMPDLSQCQSFWLQKLRGQLDKSADRQASIVHVANDLAHYTANFGPLRPGDLLLLIDTIDSMTSRMRDDLKTIPTADQRRAVITQVVQVMDVRYVCQKIRLCHLFLKRVNFPLLKSARIYNSIGLQRPVEA